MYDLIVIGGGPAGLTATIYAIRKRLNVLLISEDLGGKTNYRLAIPWVDNYQVIRGLEVVNKFKSELEYLNFARHMEAVDRVTKQDDGFTVYTRGGGELRTRAIIVATGAKQMRLRVPGEKEFIMRGLCYSAVSYAPLFIDKTSVVVGDCELALRAAGELSTVATRVHLVTECSDVLDSPLGVKLKAAQNVEILEGYRPVEVLGQEYAERIVLQTTDGSDEKLEIKADAIFVEMGLIPNAQMVADLVDLDEDGHIIVDPMNRTSTKGIFAAGDVTNIYGEQVLISVGEGAKAALSAYEYLLPML